MLIVSVSIYIHISVSAPTPAARVRFHPLFFFLVAACPMRIIHTLRWALPHVPLDF
jgi:hypothetical protein